MQKHTYTVRTNRSGPFKPEQVTVTEFTYAEMCFDEQREIHWRRLPTGPDVRYNMHGGRLHWRRIPNYFDTI